MSEEKKIFIAGLIAAADKVVATAEPYMAAGSLPSDLARRLEVLDVALRGLSQSDGRVGD